MYRKNSQRIRTDISISFGLFGVLLFFLASGIISYLNTRMLREDAKRIAHTHEVIITINDVMSYMKDAETGQRGFVLTGDDRYLQPYTNAIANIDEKFAQLERLTQDNAEQQARIPAMRKHVDTKLAELDESIQARRNRGLDAAMALIKSDRGKKEMDATRSQAQYMQQAERDLRESRIQEMARAYDRAVTSGILSCILGIILSTAVALLIRRASLMRRKQEWTQSGQVGLANVMLGEQRVELLAENILKFLASYFDAHAGAFFIRNHNIYNRIATYGIASDSKTPQSFTIDEGLLGQAAKENKVLRIDDVPDGYIKVGSALGDGNPRHLIITPAYADGETNAVIELGFMHPLSPESAGLIKEMSAAIGTAIQAAIYRSHLQNLLEETQRQAEELQSQSEELRVNNEELEEQSRALKESQARLEQQQTELEQTNAQLEEQTQQLEAQKEDISRANVTVQLKAQELERASQYKSDFLANMSHELRTPLNSSLILAKLLADNKAGNLTPEQVKFAQTIQSAGNDLLTLINDILDLSKIEAGHMEIQPESVSLERLTGSLLQTFEALAAQKGLSLKVHTAKNCPAKIETDRLRLEQILKNLISNAIKFTDRGSVELAIDTTSDNRISFAVSDTGIGIDANQQQTIFDAFRQADGTISRRYGGTGLGLSISRELSRLLGGTIALKSEPGKGSTFTITIPLAYDPAHAQPHVEPVYHAPASGNGTTRDIPASQPLRKFYMEDDRERLRGDSRVLLVVEDDESFARILFDLAHELDFDCLVATSAEEAIMLVRQYMPHAVILDVGLPDNSGLSVLDRIKRDSRTRHIPVHVISANDYTKTALSLGAVGYMLKPVKREELAETLKSLETRLSQRMRRVLIVEDDKVQRDSVRQLLGSHDVETVGVGTAAECLEKLKESTFDCMVLDLSLPDASGYSLLETLSSEDAYSFPPAIVYTGRALSADEEQRLRKYSKSIIIKGAKSPERLLDEVTLFVHQVVADLPAEQQRMLEAVRNRDSVLEGSNILVVEDDTRNVYAITSILEPCGAKVHVARNGREALEALEKRSTKGDDAIDLVLMDVMMPEMDGLTATRKIRQNKDWKKLPIIMLTAKAMRDDQERCLDAGANDYMAKPLDIEKLLSLVRVWMPR